MSMTIQMPEKWRVIDTGVGEAGQNMALDEALLTGLEGQALPVLRLYGWEPSVSFGRFQKVAESINITALQSKNLGATRRMTGGGALVHGGDLSYSLVFPRSLTEELGVKESYRMLCRFLLHFYDRLGLEAWFAVDAGLEGHRSPVCLASNEPYDLVINGQKMGGNAQRYTKQGVLIHGSIPMRLDAERFEGVFTGESGLEQAASLDRLGTRTEYGALAKLLTESFGEVFEVETVPGVVTQAEAARAGELLNAKYANSEWVYHAK